MKPFILYLFSLVAAGFLMLSGGCQDDDLGVLPPATQEGKNTFGCLVNGEVWVPAGKPRDRKLDLSYDPGFRGGAFNVSAYKTTNDVDQFMVIGGNGINEIGIYNFVPNGQTGDPGAIFTDQDLCSYLGYEFIQDGWFKINRLDLEAQIISGTFEFTLAKPDCDTIRVTEGRFDMKI